MNFACPSCGFRVFNRRYSKCERCGKELPQALLLSGAQTDRLNSDAQASHRAQAECAAVSYTPAAIVLPGLGGSIAIGAADIVIDVIQDLADGTL